MKLNTHIPKFTLLILLFTPFCFMGCLSTMLGQGPRRPPQPATVGLKLQPGEICHYTAKGDGYSFDLIFHVTKEGEASFKRIAVKSPTVNYVHEGGSWSIVGGNIQISMFDLKIEINPVVARVCAGEKCFAATVKPKGNWMVSQLPFSTNAK
ncbi:MAG: hypothetical protein OXU23_08725 [Candidatus Poribacteria bacterium]|nr:hypothetical protein [Candidatus Poribacteria bacterium]